MIKNYIFILQRVFAAEVDEEESSGVSSKYLSSDCQVQPDDGMGIAGGPLSRTTTSAVGNDHQDDLDG